MQNYEEECISCHLKSDGRTSEADDESTANYFQLELSRLNNGFVF